MNSTNISKISDFSDKLNPMLVKELRQGMRGTKFVSSFVGFQLLLCFTLLVTAQLSAPETAGSKLSNIIFFFFFLASIVFQPFRGLPALQQEIKDNTIDLLCMTRLDAWRITYGKWLSIVSQTALLLTAIIPYLILRYFFGDMQLFSEILSLITLFILSATLTALAIALSAIKTLFIRRLIPVVGIVLLFNWLIPLSYKSSSSGSALSGLTTLHDLQSVLIYLGFLGLCAYIIWFCLDFGTSMIAPLSENRATKRRLITLGSLGILITSCLIVKVDPLILSGYLALFCIPIIIVSLTENSYLLPVTIASFQRKGALGKITKYVLYPGWASGLIYTLLLYALIQAVLYSIGYPDYSPLPAINTVFSILLFPIAMTSLFFRKTEKRKGFFTIFMVVQLVAFLSLYLIAKSVFYKGIMSFFFWIPTCMIYLSGNSSFDSKMLPLSYLNVLIYSIIPLVMSIPIWKRHKEMEKQTLTSPS